MKVLVTGGAGFIGSHVVKALKKHGIETHVLVRRKEQIRLVKEAFAQFGDLHLYSDMKRVTDGMDYVVHLAAATSHIPEAHPDIAIKTNIKGTWNLKRACWENGIERIIFASSSYVYGQPWWHPVEEAHGLRPKGLFGVTKLAGEKILQATHPEQVPYTILRLFNVYGPNQLPSEHYSSVMTTWIPKAIRKESLEIHGNGSQKLDFIFVEDVARAFLKSIISKDAENQIFNVGSGEMISMNTLAREINRLAENPTHSHYNREHTPYFSVVQARISRIRNTIGWIPRTSLEGGLKRTIAFFKELDAIKKLVKK